MSESIEYLRAMKESEREFRQRAKAARTKYIQDSGLEHTIHNNGEHIVVCNEVDFWPSTGLWIVRRGRYRRHGVKGLVAYLQTLISKGAL